MSIEIITLLLGLSMILVLASGLPIVFGLGGVALIFTLFLWGSNGLAIVVAAAWGLMASWVFIAAPLFVFMALVLQGAGVADDLFHMVHVWMGGLKGGLAVGTVWICTIFAAMVGVSSAATITMGLIALPAMLKRRYSSRIAIGCVAAGGALGLLIPPSIDLIIYGLYTRTSIGKLFAAGMMPGLLLSAIYSTYIAIRCRLQPKLGPALPPEERLGWGPKLRCLKAVVLPMILVVMVLGSIFMGIATPTEAAAIGAVGALISAAIYRRLTLQVVLTAARTTFKLTSMVSWVILGASCFATLYAAMGAADLVESLIIGMPGGRWAILIAMQLSFFVMGMFMDSIPIIMIAAPIYVPIATSLGFDPLWYAMLFMVNMQMSYLTPPFGIVLFYMVAILPEGLNVGDVYRSMWPMNILQAIGLIIVMIFPPIALWLPSVILG